MSGPSQYVSYSTIFYHFFPKLYLLTITLFINPVFFGLFPCSSWFYLPIFLVCCSSYKIIFILLSLLVFSYRAFEEFHLLSMIVFYAFFAKTPFAASVIMSLNWSFSVSTLLFFTVVNSGANFHSIIALNSSATLGPKLNFSGLELFGLPQPDFKVHHNHVVITPDIRVWKSICL